jgi:hypothetical protein
MALTPEQLKQAQARLAELDAKESEYNMTQEQAKRRLAELDIKAGDTPSYVEGEYEATSPYEHPDPMSPSAMAARLAELDAKATAMPEEDVSFGDRLERGLYETGASIGSGIEAMGDITGSETLTQYGEEMRLGNKAKANEAAPEIQNLLSWGGLGDAITESLPSVGAMAAGAATGAAIGAPIPLPGTTALGGLIGLGLTSFGMNLGDIKQIEESLDPESKSNLASLGFAGLATAPDVLTGGMFSATGKVGKDILKQAVKDSFVKRMVKNTAVAVGGAGLSAASVLGGAHVSTQIGIDDERLDAYAENVAVSSLLGGALSLTATPSIYAARMAQQKLDIRDNETSPIKFDEEGKIYYQQPNAAARADTGVFSDAMGTIKFGRAVDQVNAIAKGNDTVRDITSDFDMNFVERGTRVGKHTVNTEAKMDKVDALEIGGHFDLKKMSDAGQRKVKEDVYNGVDTPQANKVRAMLRHIYDRATEAGIKLGDRGENYLPFFLDIKKLKANTEGFRTEMVEYLTPKHGVEEATRKVNTYIQESLADGGTRFGDEAKMSDNLKEAIEKAVFDGNVDALRKPLVNVKKKGSINKTNNLELHRALSAVPEEIMQKWSKDLPLSSILEQYAQVASERIAYAKRFGADNELLNERVRMAVLEGYEKGKPLSMEAIDKVYELANLQQRITSTKVTPESRQRTAAIKSALNTVLLPTALIPSLIEPLYIVPKTGAVSAGKGLFQALGVSGRKLARIFNENVPQSEREAVLASLDSSFTEAVGIQTARWGDDTITPSQFDSYFFTLNLLAPFTEFTKIWSQLAAVDSFAKEANIAIDVTKSASARRAAGMRLAEAGLDVAAHSEWVANGSKKTDPHYRNVRAAAISLAEDVVFEPNPTNKPMWSSNPGFLMQMFSHLKTFPLQFNNRIALPVLTKLSKATGRSVQDLAKTATMAATASLGYAMIDQLKSFVRTGSNEAYEEKSDGQKWMGIVSGMGSASMVIDPFNAASFGKSALDVVAGPGLSMVGTGVKNLGASIADILSGDKDPGEVVDELTKKSLHILPNIMGSREALSEVVGG